MNNKFLLVFIAIALLLFTFGCTGQDDFVLPYTTSQLIAQSTDLNYTLFKQGFYDGNCLGLDNNLLTVFDCNTGGGGSNSWNDLTDFPSECGENQAVRIIGTTLTCVDLPVDTNVYTAGILSSDNNSVLIDLNLGGNNIFNVGDVNATRFFGDGSGLTGISTLDTNFETAGYGDLNMDLNYLQNGDNISELFNDSGYITSYLDTNAETACSSGQYLDGNGGCYDVNALGGGGSSVSFGTSGQVPFTNATTDDFDYSSDFTFDGTELFVGTNAIIDDTSTEAFLVRKDADGGDVFVVNTTNSRVGIGTTPSHQFHVVGNNLDFYTMHVVGGTTGAGYGQYINLQGGDGANDATAGYSEGGVGGANYFRAGNGGDSNAGSGNYSYSAGGVGGLSQFVGGTGGDAFASGVGSYAQGGDGSVFSMNSGAGGFGVGGGEVYGGSSGGFTMSANAGGKAYATQDDATVTGGSSGQFYLVTGAGGDAYNYYPTIVTPYDNVGLTGGTASGLFLTVGNGGGVYSDSADTTSYGSGGGGGGLIFTSGTGGSGAYGGSITGGNAGNITFNAGNGGAALTPSDGTGGNGGIITFKSGKKGSGSTADGTDGYTRFTDNYNNEILRILGDGSEDVWLPNDNGAILFGAGRDASIYYNGADLIIDSAETGSGATIFENGRIYATGNNLPSSGVGITLGSNGTEGSIVQYNWGSPSYPTGGLRYNAYKHKWQIEGIDEMDFSNSGILTIGEIDLANDYSSDAFKLRIGRENQHAGFIGIVASNTTTHGTLFNGRKASGTASSPGATVANDRLIRFGGGGYSGSDWTGNAASIEFLSAGNWTVSSYPTQIDFYTTASGSTSETNQLRIDSAGDVHILNDNQKLYFGAGDDASIYYDGSNLIVNPKEVGSGYLNVAGDVLIDEDLNVTGNLFVDSNTQIKPDGNIIMTSPNGTKWNCGVDNLGNLGCS